ncbi:MAG: hypothetical protein L0Z62_22230 [Gemmataceae bacterium]|nr:hypothetical protein [Gemmataceae bacterium]
MNGTWERIAIAAKQADVYDPPGVGPRFGVLFLHDLDEKTLSGNETFTRRFAELRLACVCPHGKACWWGDRPCIAFDSKITPERYLLEEALPFFEQRWGLRPRAVGLLGIGMGGQGVLRLAFKHAALFPVAAAIAPALDCHDLHGRGTALDQLYDSKEQCRQDTALMHVPPFQPPPHLFFGVDAADFWYRGNDRLHEKLNALGVAHTLEVSTRAGGHSWDYFDKMADRAVRFVHAGLEQEGRRLL